MLAVAATSVVERPSLPIFNRVSLLLSCLPLTRGSGRRLRRIVSSYLWILYPCQRQTLLMGIHVMNLPDVVAAAVDVLPFVLPAWLETGPFAAGA